ncbi:ferric iron uptake transcriptional regulator [Thioalkalivibrio paradoxus]|uniref:Ferric uptake regulation protein n=1 Tax=Thioalkalivibrio paradoxus ARh 1 TaxID=713585 RepID=W0DPX3_9GAMM|nr:ferric iron uptake transcriptional regulator [Thioalkalivibrio paradoxus]AHE99048.1 Fur family transcriptional regulator [Thioalkalivibrio paradoxus ARh 1]
METQNLKKAGLKVTLPRMKILQILEESETRHLTAEAIYRELLDSGEEIGLATVYRVLTQFEAAGLVSRLRFEGNQAVFELDRGGHHDHIICNQCGRVEEFFDDTIEQRQREIAAEHGYRIQDHALVIHGDCIDENCPHRPG